MSTINTLARSAARASASSRLTMQNGFRQQSRRAYSDGRPPLPQGGNTRPIQGLSPTHTHVHPGSFLALVAVTIPALAWYTLGGGAAKAGQPASDGRPPAALNPAERMRQRRADEPDAPKYKHPEHEDPKFRARFGEPHAQKRVDSPPDGRNHQALQDRNRQYD
ncbi:hypothetical protein F4780DRAFT_584215 [Xylariomycetidae sp. FL0641]|nr:hypothetical protein F4780DRAFT_584215 [Xylariomycetidae sp. FL0641]